MLTELMRIGSSAPGRTMRRAEGDPHGSSDDHDMSGEIDR